MNNRFARLAKPYEIFLYIFAVVPALFMFFLVFVDMEGLDLGSFSLTLDNFAQLKEASTLMAFFNSLALAFLTTVISIILGYLVAYKIFRSNFKNKFLVIVILVLPMWSNILLRTYALANIMDSNNIVTSILSQIFNRDITFIKLRGSFFAVMIGLIVTYVPFMVMPIYNALEKIDPQIEDAALDLGLTEFKKFWKIILPMSTKGIVTGSIMVFLPSLSGFAIPQIIGDEQIVMIGNVIEELFKNMNYNVGSLLALIILIFILASVIIVNKLSKDGEPII